MNRDRKLFELLKDFSVFAGKMALPYYGSVSSAYKKIVVNDHVVDSPTTTLDHGIQEMLLAELLRQGHTDLAFNGEEETHLKFFFSNDYSRNTTLHCDPIDGTLAFTKGVGRFCSGYGLSHYSRGKHDFFSTVIYSPQEKKLYTAFGDEVSSHTQHNPPKRKYVSLRFLNNDGHQKMLKMGYSPNPPDSCHLSITDLALGKTSAFMWKHIEVHDALLPYAFARNYGAILTDIHGNELKKFDLEVKDGKFARIPAVCYFANKEIKDELLPLIQNSKYTM